MNNILYFFAIGLEKPLNKYHYEDYHKTFIPRRKIMAEEIKDITPAGYLEGQLLIATPSLQESCFESSVIYIFAHDKEGAMGVIINQLVENLSSSMLLSQLGVDPITVTEDIPVYFGGPVESGKGFLIHNSDYTPNDPIKTHGDIALSSNIDILKNIVKGNGPEKLIFALGYAGWTAGQLEKEIEDNSWLTVPATSELIFDCNNKDKWQQSAESIGIDILKFSNMSGHA